MDQDDITRLLNTTVGSFIQDRLIDKEQRNQQREQCAERLAAEDGTLDKDTEVRYSDQAVLANLDWGIDALEEAISTSNIETKLARLDYAEKMLQVCAMLDASDRTAGVPNNYLSAWAHLNLSYLWYLRDNLRNVVLHVLEMFTIDPFFSRIDFAPELWKNLFLSHMDSVVGWYTEERHKLVMDVVPDSSDLSFSVDFDVVFSMRPDQAEKVKKLENLYGGSLDENTRLYAKHFKECVNYDSATSKKVVPMLPIVEPPMTPLREVSRSIPDFVKFGPILPQSAGFPRDASRLKMTRSLETLEESPRCDPHHKRLASSEILFPVHKLIPYPNITKITFESALHANNIKSALLEKQITDEVSEEEEEECDETDDDDNSGNNPNRLNLSENRSRKIVSLKSFKFNKEKEIAPNSIPRIPKSRMYYSPEDSPKIHSPSTPSPKKHSPMTLSPKIHSPTSIPRVPSPKLDVSNKRESKTSMLRLLSSRMLESTSSPSLPETPRLRSHNSFSSVESNGEGKERRRIRSRSFVNETAHVPEISSINENYEEPQSHISITGSEKMTSRSRSPKDFSLNENDEEPQSYISIAGSEKSSSRSRPPKDFVCPITSQLFNDPVTLETGQTYEKKAIQEWMKRGNTTCPITRQPLNANTLPKTNYVLKRLISSWKEQHPDITQEFSFMETPRNSLCPLDVPSESSPYRTRNANLNSKSQRFNQSNVSLSPVSVLSQAVLEKITNDIKPFVTCLCNSENLQECEGAVLKISNLWKEAKGDSALHSYLDKPKIVNGFMEILSASREREVLRKSAYILSELISADETVAEILNTIDSNFESLSGLLKDGLHEATVLIYLLSPTLSQLSSQNIIPSLVQIIQSKGEDGQDCDFRFVIEPKDAAVAMLDILLIGGDENSRKVNAISVISANGVPALVKCLDQVDGNQSVVSILLSCIYADRSCKNLIARRIDLSPILDIFYAGSDSVRGICIDFLSEIVQLDRRTFSNQVLQIIKDEGAFSTMHTLLVYLQMAPMDQQLSVATLLLQLDLLNEPRKMSIYREESIEAIIEALRKKDLPNSQLMALDALISLSGRLTPSGKPCVEAWLLKLAGFDQQYNTLMKAERTRIHGNESAEALEEEEKAACSWERRVAFVLCNHEKGDVFKALEECLKSTSIEMAKSCLVIATWLVHMLYSLPDTGVRDAARKYLLDQFINVLQSSKNLEEKILATVALRNFITDPGALNELAVYAKCVYKTLRKLKKNSPVVNDILKALMNLPSVNATDMWSCNEAAELNSSTNGEVLSVIHLNGRLFSSHSDGTIKVWDTVKKVPRLIQEVREHSKAVTCLHVSSSGDKLYTGSLDKTIRVWAIKQEEIHCLQVHDVKEAVYGLTANSSTACFFSQGTGVKIYSWTGVLKQVNFNKSVKSLAMLGSKLYCGCTGYSIQEVDLSKLTSSPFYLGAKKILGKQTIHSLRIHHGYLYAGGSSVDGIAGKVFSLSTKAVIGSFSTNLDICNIAISNDFIFTATKCGLIEVWLKERVTRVASINTCTSGNGKITSLESDTDGEMLFSSSSDGKIKNCQDFYDIHHKCFIRVWGLD